MRGHASRAYKRDPQTSKHFSWVGCVNAAGNAFTPFLIVEGKRLMASFNKGWPEMHVGMDDQGYMNGPLFFRWCQAWEKETRALAGGRPRVLFVDNHYSHHAVDALIYLREHNVRVVGMHPHTTHVLCALDCGIFRSFKHHFERALSELPHTCLEEHIPALIKKAWGEACKITIDPINGLRDSVVIRAFKKVGLAPFNRDVLDKQEYALSEHYKDIKTEIGADDAGAQANPKRARLTLTEEQKKEYREKQKRPSEAFVEQVKRVRQAGRQQMAQLLTDPDVMDALAAAQKAAQEKEEKKAQQPWTLAGMPFRDWQKQQAGLKAQKLEEEKEATAQAAAAEKAAAAAPKAAAAVPPPPPPPPPPKPPAAKKKKAQAHFAAPVAPPPVAADRGEGKRGVKRPRALDV